MGFLGPTDRQSAGFEAYSGGRQYFPLTAAMGTAAQQVKSGNGRLAKIYNPQAASAIITVYDAASADATTLSTALIIFKGTLPATTAPVDLQLPVNLGIVVVASPAVAQTILIGYV